jgi:hypothetical protein
MKTSPYFLPSGCPATSSAVSSNTTFMYPSMLCKLPWYSTPLWSLTLTELPMMSLKNCDGSVFASSAMVWL